MKNTEILQILIQNYKDFEIWLEAEKNRYPRKVEIEPTLEEFINWLEEYKLPLKKR